MRSAVAALSLLIAGCTTATPGFDTLTPPPPPSLAASAAPSLSIPTFSLVPVTAAPRTATPPTPRPRPSGIRTVIFVVWDGGTRAGDGSIPMLVVLKDFPQSTSVTFDRYRDPAGTQRPLGKVVTTAGSQTTFTMNVTGPTGVYALDFRHPLNGTTQGQIQFTVSKTIADRASGATTSSPCPSAPVTGAFDPSSIPWTGQTTAKLTGVCTGEIVTIVRVRTADGYDFTFSGEQTTVAYPQGLGFRPSESFGLGTHTVFFWVKGRELPVPLQTR